MGALACQQNAFLKELSTVVVSCTAQDTGYEVVLADTILFPEGGGQPFDVGYIDDIEVTNVQRRGTEAIHFLSVPLDKGKEVVVKVNWERRFDHMQQHSGQHLITAIAQAECDLITECWHLGEKVSYIQMASAKITEDQVACIEARVNACILDQLAVTVIVSDDARHDPRIRKAQKGLPEDMTGPVRVVEMQGIEQNLCCGTHVSNLGQLQGIKLLHTETKKGSTLLYFVAGNRMLDTYGGLYKRERTMSKLLSGLHPEQHAEMVESMRKDVTKMMKVNKTVSLELAEYFAKDLAATLDPAQYDGSAYFYHRDEVTSEFLGVISDKLLAAHPSLTSVLTCGAPKDNGIQFLVSGPADRVADIGPKVMAALHGKGGCAKAKFRGKGTNGKAVLKLQQMVFAM